MQALVFLESFSAVHSTVSYPCAQRSCILLTPIRTIHNTHFQVNVCTSGRQWVDWSPLSGSDFLHDVPEQAVGNLLDFHT